MYKMGSSLRILIYSSFSLSLSMLMVYNGPMSKVYSFSCTRSESLSQTSKNLEAYFNRFGVDHTWLIDQKSIFSAYHTAINDYSYESDDIIVLCHDDIEIWDDPINFHTQLKMANLKNMGFIGVAGTTVFDKDGMWWDMERRKQNLHRGFVWQGTCRKSFYPNYFGKPGRVVCLDGCFLAASVETLRSLDLEKPDFLEDEWDFYDIYYTLSAHKSGRINFAAPISILHNSPGEMRPSWYKNRDLFVKHYKLPIRTF